MVNNIRPILTALAYSDGFDFPLTLDELWLFLPPSTVKKEELPRLIKKSSHLSMRGAYICLKGREVVCDTRRKHDAHVKKQRIKAQKIAGILSRLPWVLCICISGSLAAGQYKAHDDIDFFVITKRDTIWLSRLCILGLLQILGKRRKKEEIHAPHSICVNMFIDTKGLFLGVLGQDIYVAREIAQLKVLVNKQKTFEKFLIENRWAHTFLPHAFSLRSSQVPDPSVSSFSKFMNTIARYLQMKSITRTKTTERIEEHLVAFHPVDYHHRILAQFEAKVRTIPH